MYETDGGARYYSATDLLTWHGCAHASRLDALALADRELRDWLAVRDAVRRQAIADGTDWPEPANVRGDQHEHAMLERLRGDGLTVVTIPRPRGHDGLLEAVRETTQALADGADVVYQAALLDEPWFGYADFLVRVDGHRSRFGDYAYEVRDTKLARSPSAGALIQMAHYGSILARLQEAPPPSLVVWLGTGEEFRWPYRDAVPYLDELRARFLAFHADAAPTEATPVDHCSRCRWYERCDEEWGPADLRHVHRLTRRQRLVLREGGIRTVAQLAAADDAARPEDIGDGAFRRLRAQAAAQVGEAPFALVRPQPRAAGAAGTPAPHPLDLYFDLEGDPYAALPTLDYLWAWYDTDGYHHRWAHDRDDERAAFLWFLDELHRREALGGEWHVYHYNSYEVTALERIAENWPDPVESARLVAEVARLVEERFDDLYRRVESGVRTRDGSTSLKIVEKLAGYLREADTVARADDSIKAYEAYLASTDDAVRAELLEGIRAYNEDDVRATHAVHLWLRDIARGLGEDDLEDDDVDTYEPSQDVVDRLERTAALQARLQAAADEADAGGSLASGLSVPGARMLAEMLEWHRREFVVAYQDFLRLKDWAAERDVAPDGGPQADPAWIELNGEPAEQTRIRRGTEHESCLLAVEEVFVHPPVTGRANEARLREYRARPGAWKLKVGADVEEVVPDGLDRPPLKAKLENHDPETGAFSFKKGSVPPGPLGPLVASPFIDPPVVWDSLMRLGEQALSEHPADAAGSGFRLLDRRPPLAADRMQPRDGEGACDRARRLLGELTAGLLPVQGPPGTGKTWLAAQMVLDEIARDGRACIGVVANSHRVIDNLLGEVARLAAEHGIDVAVGHVARQVTVPGVARIDGGGRCLVPWLDAQRAAGKPAVAGATKFGWSRADAASSVRLLIVDEAGQVALADAVAVAQASARIVALGDPQQLASPIQASHDESVRLSLLEHLAQGAAVLPAEVGVFLDVSHRMHPALCEVVGELAYDGSLKASPAAAARSLSGPDLLLDGFRIPLRPGVLWVPTEAVDEEQAEVVADLVGQLLSHALVSVDGGAPAGLGPEDVLVVSPHNAHVNRIAAAIGNGDHVGTVDKFQGQQGHVVVYAMSRPAEEAGDVPFLYELNRVNVALSRARLMAIVVAHPDATFPPVRQPEHLRLASRFARALEGRKARR